jgi:hypothetical protein
MGPDQLSIMIPIVAIVCGIAAAIFSMYYKYRMRQKLFDERAKLIDAMREAGEINLEKIKELQDPKLYEQFLGLEDSNRDRTANFKAAIILFAVSIALWLLLKFLVVDAEGESPAIQTVALFPGLIGAALLIIHFTCQPKKGETDDKDKDLRKFQ